MKLPLNFRNAFLPLFRSVASVLMAAALCSDAGAGTFTVTNANDAGAGSLRQAIADANANAGADKVDFAVDLAGKLIVLQSGELTIASDVEIDASNLAERPVIDGNGPVTNDRVLQVGPGNQVVLDFIVISNGGTQSVPPDNCGGGIFNDGGTLTIRNCTISGNEANDNGGGIWNNGGTVTIENSTVSGNSGQLGGGIWNDSDGSVTITDSTVSNNPASLGGGGIFNSGTSVLVVNRCTVSGNTAGFDGGGILCSGSVTISNSTIANNQGTDGGGGGVYQNPGGTLTITNSTVTGNTSPQGGGIFNSGGTCTITNTIIGGNSSTGGPDLDNTTSPGVVNTGGANLFSDLTGSGLSAGSTVIVGDPLLSELGDHGGGIQTVYPLPGSPAIDAGSTTDPGGTDQRGFSRFFNGALDLGAVEVSPEIDVQASAMEGIPSGAGQIDFGSVGILSTSSRTITIRNTGTGKLVLIQVTMVGVDATNFSVGSPGNSSLDPGESTAVQISFTPGVEGPILASLLITNNDEDEGEYFITLKGTGTDTIDPEIDVEQPAGTGLTDGVSKIDFGDVAVGSSVKKTFTVRNSGTANLTGLAVSRSGTDASDFAIGSLGAASLFPGASTTFTVTYSPGATGSRSASIRIASNDSDENPFEIQLTGTGVNAEVKPKNPEIAVTVGKKSQNLKDGRSTSSFQTTEVGMTSKVVTFRIENKGKKKLKDLKVKIRGRHSKDFLLVKKPSGSALAAGKTMVFKVAFKPRKAGNRKAELQILSNDKNESPFSVTLKGKGEKVSG